MKILAIIRARSTHACLSPLHSYFHTKGNGRNVRRKIHLDRRKSPSLHSGRPLRILSENGIVRGAKVSRLLPSNNERPSYLNGEGSKPRLSLEPRTEKQRNDKKEGGRGEEEKKEGRKEERSASRAFSRGGEGEGNSKEAGISSAFAWKYRSRDGIPIDRIFRNGEILQSLPSLLSRFIIFRLYHLPLLITVNGN